MRSIRLALLCLAVHACADDELASAIGELHLELCDRGAACGCEVLGVDDGIIDFGSPGAGGVSQRTLLIKNDNQPRQLIVEQLLIDDSTGSFTIAAVRRRSGPGTDAAVSAHDMAGGPLKLEGSEEAEVVLAFSPHSDEGLSASLTVVSTSGTRPSWRLGLRGGGGSSAISAGAISACSGGCTLDFGTYQDEEIGPDFADPEGRPVALGSEAIVIENTGASDIFVTVELTNDGIPERPGELLPRHRHGREGTGVAEEQGSLSRGCGAVRRRVGPGGPEVVTHLPGGASHDPSARRRHRGVAARAERPAPPRATRLEDGVSSEPAHHGRGHLPRRSIARLLGLSRDARERGARHGR